LLFLFSENVLDTIRNAQTCFCSSPYRNKYYLPVRVNSQELTVKGYELNNAVHPWNAKLSLNIKFKLPN